jgi:type II secretory pathway pseudopilin PulG
MMRTCLVRAYTLLEVLIVLALMTTIILLISVALDIHLRQMVINRTDVEQAHLARIIMEKIAQDIRSVLVPLREEILEVDTSALTGIMGLEGAADLLNELDLTENTGEENGEDYEEQYIYGTLPGIYGGVDASGFHWIQIDTAKLPRGEMYGSRQIRRGTSGAADRLSASKTVLYYLGSDTGMMSIDDPRYQPEKLIGSLGRSLDYNAPQYGLFRRQLDRQAMQYAIQEGLEFEDEQFDEPLAPEVEFVEFYYFDPTIEVLGERGDWVTEWDMDERQMLPLAVQIVVAIRRPDFGRSWLSFGGSTGTTRKPVVYSLIVPIPVSVEVIYEEEEEMEEGVD